MRDFTRRGKKDVSRFLLTALGLCILFFITVVAVRASWGMYSKFSEAAASDAQAQSNLVNLQAQAAQVSASVDDLRSQRGIEAQVRETYGVAKPGEGEIQIVRDASSTGQGREVNDSVWSKIWQALFGWL